MSSQIEQVEVTIDELQAMIDQRDAMIKLTKNREFKKIIDVGYFQDEAARLVAARANPGLQDEAAQRSLNNQITAVGELRQYFSGIFQMASQAELGIAEHQITLDELRAEELASDSE